MSQSTQTPINIMGQTNATQSASGEPPAKLIKLMTVGDIASLTFCLNDIERLEKIECLLKEASGLYSFMTFGPINIKSELHKVEKIVKDAKKQQIEKSQQIAKSVDLLPTMIAKVNQPTGIGSTPSYTLQQYTYTGMAMGMATGPATGPATGSAMGLGMGPAMGSAMGPAMGPAIGLRRMGPFPPTSSSISQPPPPAYTPK